MVKRERERFKLEGKKKISDSRASSNLEKHQSGFATIIISRQQNEGQIFP